MAAQTPHSADIIRLSDVEACFADRSEITQMLVEQPRKLHTSLTYTEVGSDFFAQLCHQPEYYLAHTERSLLKSTSQAIIQQSNPYSIIDLGCGTMEKTQKLIHENTKSRSNFYFIPCDIDDHIVNEGVQRLRFYYDDDVTFRPLQGVYEDCIEWAAGNPGPRLFCFLGSTYGNMTQGERKRFLTTLHRTMGQDDHFLLCVDLVKDKTVMEGAYNDSAGLVRRSMFQSLANINQRYGADFDVNNFDHLARYEPERQAVIEYLVSTINQTVHIPGLDVTLHLQKDEKIESEFSEKFNLNELLTLLARHGFHPTQTHVDSTMKYAALLLYPEATPGIDALQDAA